MTDPHVGRRLVAGGVQVAGPEVNGRGSGSARLTAEQAEAWMMYEVVGEVRQAISARGALVSGCTLSVGLPPDENNEDGRPAVDELGAPTDPTVPLALVAAAEQILGDVQDSMGTHAALIAAQSECWDVAGEAFLAAWWVDAKGDPVEESAPAAARMRWEVIGPQAYRREGERSYVRLRRGSGTELLLPGTALVWRLWRRHPAWPDEPWGWVMSAAPVLRNLLAFQLAERAQALSAAAGKIHLVPAEAAPRSPVPVDGDPVDVAATQLTGDEWAEKLDVMIAEVIGEVIEDWQSGRAVQGGVLALESKYIESFGKAIEVGRPIDAALGELTDRALRRLREVADVAPEMLSGLGDTNRWNGAQISDEEWRRYHRPHLRAIADSWTSEILWPGLVGRGFALVDARRVRINVGTRGIVADPDRSKDAEESLRAGAIGWDGYRELRKIPGEYAPTPAERAEIAEFLKGQSGGGPGSGPAGPPAEVEPVNPAAGSLTSSGRAVAARRARPLGERLHLVEYGTRQALIGAGSVALDAALARGGAMLRNLARKHLRLEVPGVAAAGVARALNEARPGAVAEVLAAEFAGDERARREALFAAALAALRPRYDEIAGDGLAAVLAELGMTWPEPARPAKSPHTGATISQADLAAALDDGWETLDGSLSLYADEVLFGADPGDETDRAVPVPVFRRTLAAIGGAAVAVGYEALRPTGAVALDGSFSLAFGPRFGALEPAAALWEWSYGTAFRVNPFPEHVELDGTPISGPDDPALSGAPWGSYWPGDHLGCLCDVVPVFDVETP